MTQRDLVLVLRLLLDRKTPTHPPDVVRSLKIVADNNPRSIWSTKVLHNIGRGRTARLLLMGIEPRDPNTRARVRDFSNSMRATRSLVAKSEGEGHGD